MAILPTGCRGFINRDKFKHDRLRIEGARICRILKRRFDFRVIGNNPNEVTFVVTCIESTSPNRYQHCREDVAKSIKIVIIVSGRNSVINSVTCILCKNCHSKAGNAVTVASLIPNTLVNFTLVFLI